jgi:hypothetical protein
MLLLAPKGGAASIDTGPLIKRNSSYPPYVTLLIVP